MWTEEAKHPTQHLCPEVLGDGTYFSATQPECHFKPSWVPNSTPAFSWYCLLHPHVNPWKMVFARGLPDRRKKVKWMWVSMVDLSH